MLNTKKIKLDFMRTKTFFPVLLALTHCMAVQVPEDYVTDLYYADQPKVMSLTPSTSMSWTTLRPTIQIKFNNPMDLTSISVDTGGTCTGAIQLYDNNNLGCRALTLGTTENRNSVIHVSYAADLDPNSDYIITVQGTITDFRGKTLGSDATYPFKSGVPSGTEPRVVSVTASAFTGFPQDVLFTITFSRQIAAADIAAAAAGGDWCSHFAFSLDNFASCKDINFINSAGAPTYTVNYKQAAAGIYVFTIKKGMIDNFGVASVADFSVNYP